MGPVDSTLPSCGCRLLHGTAEQSKLSPDSDKGKNKFMRALPSWPHLILVTSQKSKPPNIITLSGECFKIVFFFFLPHKLKIIYSQSHSLGGKKNESVSCPVVLTLCDPMDVSSPGFCPWDSPGKSTVMIYHFLLQGIFLAQGSNLGPLHCCQILYRLSHQGSLLNQKDKH